MLQKKCVYGFVLCRQICTIRLVNGEFHENPTLKICYPDGRPCDKISISLLNFAIIIKRYSVLKSIGCSSAIFGVAALEFFICQLYIAGTVYCAILIPCFQKITIGGTNIGWAGSLSRRTVVSPGAIHVICAWLVCAESTSTDTAELIYHTDVTACCPIGYFAIISYACALFIRTACDCRTVSGICQQ